MFGISVIGLLDSSFLEFELNIHESQMVLCIDKSW